MTPRPLFFACIAVASFALLPARAADGDRPLTQQERFAECGHQSKGLAGEEHRRFMSECLRGRATTPAAETPREAASEGAPQNRMRACSGEAREKELHGDERRAFMSACLKG